MSNQEAGSAGFRLSAHTTTGVGGVAQNYTRCESETALLEAIAQADARGQQILILGSGSNLLVADQPLPQHVIHIAYPGFDFGAGFQLDTQDAGQPAADSAPEVLVRAAAGQPWDAFVAATVDAGLSGLEMLSGIPGLAGATPVQNVGAYGSDISQVLTRAKVYDRASQEIRWLAKEELKFSYRDSLIKETTVEPGSPQYVVLEVEYALRQEENSRPIRYQQLAQALHIQVGECAPLRAVRAIVLALRAGKGMIYRSEDQDSWSTGSFFTNPLLSAEQAELLPENAPRYPAGEQVKTSAAWLIEQAGFPRGFGLNERASLSTKHTLALTNRGSASAADILQLARHVRDGVEERFGIRLTPEPLLINCQL